MYLENLYLAVRGGKSCLGVHDGHMYLENLYLAVRGGQSCLGVHDGKFCLGIFLDATVCPFVPLSCTQHGIFGVPASCLSLLYSLALCLN